VPLLMIRDLVATREEFAHKRHLYLFLLVPPITRELTIRSIAPHAHACPLNLLSLNSSFDQSLFTIGSGQRSLSFLDYGCRHLDSLHGACPFAFFGPI
jgi:hypothetical protein